MIDTDKYEGHTPAPWKWIIDDKDTYLSCFDNDIKADENLIADAPLLLAEVKRLRRAWQILRSRTEMSCVVFAEYPDKQDTNTHELMDLAMKEAIE